MSIALPNYHPSKPEEELPSLAASSIPDDESDLPPTDLILTTTDDRSLPPIVLGCATFGYDIYAEKLDCLGVNPVRVVRYALRAGINAFDTSPYYHPSEIILGRALSMLRDEFPRSSYTLITKVGKYGSEVGEHQYDPATIRASVERSLKRLGTDYLDVVYLHDVEFVATSFQPGVAGHHLSALPSLKSSGPSSADTFHLAQPYTILGPGDEEIMNGLNTLRQLQQEGKIRRIGISGYPLPVLLRIALLAKSLPPMRPLDIIQTYAQQTILNDSLEQGYLEAFTEIAGVLQVMNAAPLAMGVLTDSGGPSWHPVRTQPGGQWEASREAASLCRERGTRLEVVASEFGFRELRQKDGKVVPVVVGCKNVHEVRRALESHRDAKGGVSVVGAEVVKLFEEKGVRGFSWACP